MYVHVLLVVFTPLLLFKVKCAICSSSDLSSDNSDLAMLKSLLAGLSLPTKSGILDRGSEEEKDGESECWKAIPASENAVCFEVQMLFMESQNILNWKGPTRIKSLLPVKRYLEWRTALVCSTA